MVKFIDRIIINNIERHKCKKTIFGKIIYKFGINYYRKIFKESTDRENLIRKYWGQSGGFKHAKTQFFRDDDSWKKLYVDFYQGVKTSLFCGANILEIGCSAGQWAKRLDIASNNCNFTGVDINKHSIQFASEYFSESTHIRFFESDITLINFEPYDIIISCQTLFFLTNNQVKKILKGIKKNTKVIICEPVNTNYLKFEKSVLLYKTNKINIGFSHNFNFHLEKTGFDILKSKLIKGNNSTNKIFIEAIKK